MTCDVLPTRTSAGMAFFNLKNLSPDSYFWTWLWSVPCSMQVMLSYMQAMLVGSAASDGYAFAKAFDRKIGRVGEACRQQGLAFIPLAADGGWYSGGCPTGQKAWCSACPPER